MRSQRTATTATKNGVYSLAGCIVLDTTGVAETLTFQNGQGTATVVISALRRFSRSWKRDHQDRTRRPLPRHLCRPEHGVGLPAFPSRVLNNFIGINNASRAEFSRTSAPSRRPRRRLPPPRPLAMRKPRLPPSIRRFFSSVTSNPASAPAKTFCSTPPASPIRRSQTTRRPNPASVTRTSRRKRPT